VNIKASTLFALVAIWGLMLIAVIQEPDGWWGLIFAFLASGTLAPRFWRSIGLSKLIAIAGIWLGTAAAIAADADATWMSIFAFLSTGAVSVGPMRRDAIGLGLGIAMAWLVSGTVAMDDPDAAWTSIFAFLTTGALSNSRGEWARGGSAMLWWGLAGVIMLVADGWYWLCIPAFLLSASSIGFSDFQLPKGIDWDLFDGDDDDDTRARPVDGRTL
jgi:hypothetical protein